MRKNGAVYFKGIVDSTQDEARRMVSSGIRPPFVVVAEAQTQGRGRYGRRWVSPKGGAWLTLATEPGKISEPWVLGYAASLEVSRLLRKHGLNGRVVWPNDVFVGGAKACGVLVEGDVEEGSPTCIFIGVGLNVNNDVSGIESRYPVSSMCGELGRSVSLSRVLGELADALLGRVHGAEQNDVLERYRDEVGIVGKIIKVRSGEETIEGIVSSIDTEGLLVLRTERGERKVMTGELLEEYWLTPGRRRQE